MNAQAIEVERRRGQPIMSSFHAGFSIGGLAGAVCASVFGLALSAIPIAALALAATLLVGVGLANVAPVAYSAGANSGVVPPATGIAMVATLGYGGFLLGPPAIDFVAGLAGLRAALVLVIMACLSVAALSRLVARVR